MKAKQMEFLFADLINSTKMPKWLRCAIVAAVCGFVIFLGAALAVKSPMTIGRIFGGILAAVFFVAGVYLFVKIIKSKPPENEK